MQGKLAPNELTATQIVREIDAGRLTSEAVVRACLDRIAEREAEVGAWTHVNAEQAIAAAGTLDRGAARGPSVDW